MSADVWQETSLGEFIRLQRGHDLTENDRRPGVVPVMGSGGQKGFHDTALAKGPGVVIGRSGVGSMGVVTYCQDDYWPHNTVLYVTDFRGNDERFVYYFLKQLDLRRFDSGSAQASLNRNFLYPLRIRVPDVPTQKLIAETLGSLDDKIDLNCRSKRTLESVTAAVFKSWFVDFDPVRKKMEGKSDNELGLPPSLAALFPSTMTSTVGIEHPEGWKCGELGDLVSERTQRVGSSPEAVVLSAVSSGHLVRSDDHFNKRVYSKDLGKYKIVLRNDFAYNPSRINIGSIGILHEDVLGAVSPVYVVFTPREGYANFVDFHMREGSTQAWIGQLSSGSVRQSLAYRDLVTIPAVIPSQESVAAFDNVLASVRASSKALEAQTSTLCQVRDELLPRLLSGEVDIVDR